jgi:3-carboxy-cis,cis-muconate cycloisomerase
LVKALTRRVASTDAAAARYVHWGATSQDIMDTAVALQLRRFFPAIEGDLAALDKALARLARRHRRTPMAGRTWLQHAVPVTFGLKAAGWLAALRRHRARLPAVRADSLVLQFGGAAGTLAALGRHGRQVSTALARELRLRVPEMPWHSQRDCVAALGAWIGILIGSLGKIARDVGLMMQTEVAEAFEPAAAGKGGSSSMPHKRNPVASAAVLAAAARAPGLVATLLAALPQEHERGLGGWQAEWSALPELCRLAAGALRHMRETIDGLDVDRTRMRRNLAASRGLIMAEAVAVALGERMGKPAAHALVEQACRAAAAEGRHLRDVLSARPEVRARLSSRDLDRLFDPRNYTGLADDFVARALAADAGPRTRQR